MRHVTCWVEPEIARSILALPHPISILSRNLCLEFGGWHDAGLAPLILLLSSATDTAPPIGRIQMADESLDLIELTADIVSSHVTKNSVAVADLPNLIQQVHRALASLGEPQQEPEQDAKAPVVSVRASIPARLPCLPRMRCQAEDYEAASCERT